MRLNRRDTAKSLYERVGGEAGVRRLAARFYESMQSLPEAASVRAMHEDMARAQSKLELFLTEWFGGPQKYSDNWGPPSLRLRHSAFAISPTERDAWMRCMAAALEELPLEPELRKELHDKFTTLASGLMNRQ